MVTIDKAKILGLHTASHIWKTIQEVDLRPIRKEAERKVSIAIVGQRGIGKQALAEYMRRDPQHPEYFENTPVLLLEPQEVGAHLGADLIILLVNSRAGSFDLERELLERWGRAGEMVLTVFIVETPGDVDTIVQNGLLKDAAHTIVGSLQDVDFIKKVFVPAVIDLLSDVLLALGRSFPLFRLPIAKKLIDETCMSNATYAFTTGLGEIVPALDIPLNVADIVVLTKAQAFLVYKLGLLFGYSVHWRDYITEFGSVLGSGFLWRQVSRQLVGLIPVWGIVPKTAVAYAGTYVVGKVMLLWYTTGRQASKAQIREIYKKAFIRGKDLAKAFLSKAASKRGRFFNKGRKDALLLPDADQVKICPSCGKTNLKTATVCRYCGEALL